MNIFDSDGLRLAFLDQGEGEPVVLVHGFASDAQVNWVYPGWVDTLVEAGRRAIALDVRGHGASDKPRDPAAYALPVVAEDVRALLDHLGLRRADVLGYSMGAWATAHLAIRHPERVRSAIFGGLGTAMVAGLGDAAEIATALEAEDEAAAMSDRGRAYRKFAIQTKSDRAALAAFMRGARQPVEAAALARLPMPVLVAVGTRDTVAGSAADLAALMPHGEVLDIPNRDHMLAVGDKVFKAGVLDFLRRRT